MGFKASKYFPIVAALIFMLLTTISIALQDDADTIFLDCLDKESSKNNPTSKVTYTQQNSSFLSALDALAWNKRLVRSDIRKPLVIVTAKNESDVRATLFCCKRHGLQLRIRGGGHDMEGTSYISDVPFVMLDMLNMRSIDINMEEESASVQAGAVLGEVYYAVGQKSPVHAFPGGVCPTVGVVGHFSGGGYGNLMREYGLSTDHVVDARLMDVDGNILDRKSMGEDLFWAIRGGGAASFGIILSWKVNLVRVPPLVTVFHVTRPIDTTIVTKWQKVAPNLSKKAFVRLRVSVLNDKENKQNRNTKNTRLLVLSFIGMFLGQTNELVNMLNKTFPELKLSPRECFEMPWVNSTLFWVDAPDGTPLEFLTSRQYERVARKVKSDFVGDPIPQEGIDKMFTKLPELDGLVMEWNPYGGKMSEISENSTAYPYRAGILYKIEYDFKWYEKGVDAEKYHLDLSKSMYDFMTPYVSKYPRKAFFNYRDFDVGIYHGKNTSTGFGTTYYGPNFPRLVKVKTDVDPANFFQYEQSIPPITLL